MINKYFEDEEIQQNDLFFMCSMIERVARKIHQRNKYVVNCLIIIRFFYFLIEIITTPFSPFFP